MLDGAPIFAKSHKLRFTFLVPIIKFDLSFSKFSAFLGIFIIDLYSLPFFLLYVIKLFFQILLTTELEYEVLYCKKVKLAVPTRNS